MANPSGSSPSVADRPADVEQHAAAGDPAGDGLDAGDQVALAGDDVAGAAAVPGVAVVEDVAEAVPLGGGLQRHGDHVVGAADAVREALVAALGVGAGVEHGVHRVGAPPPALLRAVRVERLGEREARPAADQGGALDALGVVEEVQRAEHVVGAPAAPVGAALRGGGDRALGVGAVERERACRLLLERRATRCPHRAIREDEMSDARASTAVDTLGAVNLASLDLNLLVSLDALLQQRSVTRAAAQMGLSQPALSASAGPAAPALRRRAAHPGRQRVPAHPAGGAAARSCARLALTGVERVFAAQPDFDPASSTREFSPAGQRLRGRRPRRHASPALLAEEAPHARLRFTANTPAVVDRAEQSLLSTDLLVLPHGFVERPVPPRPLPRRVGVHGRRPTTRRSSDGLTVEHLRDPAVGGHLPRADRGDARLAADADARHRAAACRSSPRTS